MYWRSPRAATTGGIVAANRYMRRTAPIPTYSCNNPELLYNTDIKATNSVQSARPCTGVSIIGQSRSYCCILRHSRPPGNHPCSVLGVD
jgi:hypothetical protein